MSNAPFDGGHKRRWISIGTFLASTPVNQPQTSLCSDTLADYAVVRVDYASVVLEYAVADGTASAQLIVGFLSYGSETLFLTAAGDPQTYLVGGTPTASPFGQERICAQLTTPFYMNSGFAIWLSGHGTSGSTSNAYGVVSLSGSYVN